MKIRLSVQGASLNVEVSDKKAMGIYRGLIFHLKILGKVVLVDENGDRW